MRPSLFGLQQQVKRVMNYLLFTPAKEDKNSVVITERLCLDTKSTHFKSTAIYNRIKLSTKNWNNILISSMVYKKTSVFLDTPYAHSHGELLIMLKGLLT